MGPPDSNGVSRVPFYLGSRWEVSEFRARAFHPLWGTFPGSCTILQRIPYRGPATPTRMRVGLGFSPFVRHYLGNHGCFLFLRVLRCFTSPGIAPHALFDSGMGNQAVNLAGFSHSEISGSKRICRSPKLIAAYHVLRRHSMPRHSPCALSNLTKFKSRFFYLDVICIPYLCNFQRTVAFFRLVGVGMPKSFMEQVVWRELPVVCCRLSVAGWSAIRHSSFEIRHSKTGGRTRTRTWDLVLIRDAL